MSLFCLVRWRPLGGLSAASVCDASPVGAGGSRSWMWPGMVFTTITGPNIDPSSATNTPDSESWGYITEGIRVTGTGVLGASVWPTLGVYDSAIGVTLANDDVVDTLVATTGHPISVVLRLPPQDVGSGVILWARCGAPPMDQWQQRVWVGDASTPDRANADARSPLVCDRDQLGTTRHRQPAYRGSAGQPFPPGQPSCVSGCCDNHPRRHPPT